MKRSFLSLLIVPFLFLGFSSADFNVSSLDFLGTVSRTLVSSSNSDFDPGFLITRPGKYKIVLNGISSYCPGTTSNSDCLGLLQYRYNNKNSFIAINVIDGVNSYDFTVSDNQINNGTVFRVWGKYSVSNISLYRYSDSSLYDYGLSPAVNGLRGTVYQIIPFVVYIGIGVLLAIIGFYAVRWLVNRIGLKINSYFRSKRN